MRVLVQDTFDTLNDRHKDVLHYAVQLAKQSLHIGVTVGDLAYRKDRQVQPWSKRILAVYNYVRQSCEYQGSLTILALDTIAGFALSDEFDAIVVSSDQEPTAKQINQKRIKPLQVFVIPLRKNYARHTMSSPPSAPIRSLL